MSTRLSTGLVQFLAQGGSLKRFLQGAVLCIYDGAQVTTADMGPNGNLLNTITLGSAAHTDEVLATGSVTLTGGASGSVSSITVEGNEILGATVNFNSSLNQTATDCATQINTYASDRFTASTTGSSAIM